MEDRTCTLVNLLREEHPKYADIEDYCTWSAEGRDIEINIDVDKPIFIFKTAEDKWVSDALITKHALEVYCPDGCKGCNYEGICVKGCEDKYRQMDITHDTHYCREITASEFLLGEWAWSEDGELQTGWLQFKEEGICMLANLDY
jgi:hypothetical protein